MSSLVWNIKGILDESGVSAYSLVQICQGKLSPNTVYALCRGEHKAVSLKTLETILESMETLLGRRVEIEEILKREVE